VSIVSVAVLTRLYEADAFGALAIYLSVSAVILTASSGQYELAITLPREDDDARAVAAVALVLNASLAAALLLLATPMAGPLYDAAGWSAVEPYAWLIPATVLLTGTYQVLTYWSLRTGAYGVLARTRVLQAVAQALGSIGAGLAGAGAGGLLGGNTAGRAFGVGHLIRAIDLGGAWRRGVLRPARLRSSARRYRRFPAFTMPSALVDEFRIELPTFFLAAAHGPATTGLYLLTRRLLGVPMTLVGKAIGEAYVSVAPRLFHEEPAKLLALIRSVQRRLLTLGLVPFALVVLLGPTLFEVALGEGWAKAGEYARVLAPAFLTQLVTSPVSNTLHVLERQQMMLGFEVARLGSCAGVLVVTRALGWGPTGSLAALSVTLCLSYVFLQVLILRQVRP